MRTQEQMKAAHNRRTRLPFGRLEFYIVEFMMYMDEIQFEKVGNEKRG